MQNNLNPLILETFIEYQELDLTSNKILSICYSLDGTIHHLYLI